MGIKRVLVALGLLGILVALRCAGSVNPSSDVPAPLGGGTTSQVGRYSGLEAPQGVMPTVRNLASNPGGLEMLYQGVVVSAVSQSPLAAFVSDGISATYANGLDGMFGLRTASMSVTVSARGFVKKTVQLDGGASDRMIQVALQPTSEFTVQVRTSDGEAVSEAAVVQLQGSSKRGGCFERRLGVTDAEGRYTIRHPGPLLLMARSGEYVSQPKMCSGNNVLVCDDSTSSRIAVTCQGEGVHIVLLATMLEARPGLRFRYELEPSQKLFLPAGDYAIEVVGYSTVEKVGLGLGFAGVFKNLPAGGFAEVHVKSRVSGVSVVDASDQRPVAAELICEGLFDDGWREFGVRVRADKSGQVDVGPLIDVLAGVSPGYSRVRVEAHGYQTTYLEGLPRSWGKVIGINPARELRTLRFIRDGGAWEGHLAIRAHAPLGFGALLFDGMASSAGVAIPVPLDRKLEIRSGSGRSAIVLAVLSAVDFDGGDAIEVQLPDSASITVTDVPSHENLVAHGADGSWLRPRFEAGHFVFEDLDPGRYRIGAEPILRVGFPTPAVVTVDLKAGEAASTDWNEKWTPVGPLQGRVTLANGDAVSPGLVWVLPWCGDAPRSNPALLKLAIPVRDGGEFQLPRLPHAADRLAVYGMVRGNPILLGQSNVEPLIQVDGKRVILDLQDHKSRRGTLILVAPPDVRGRSAGQWMVSCSTRQKLDLGVLPAGLLSAVLMIDGAAPRVISLASEDVPIKVTFQK